MTNEAKRNEDTTVEPLVRPSGLDQCAAILARQSDGPRCSCCGRRIIVDALDVLADPTQCEAEVGPNVTEQARAGSASPDSAGSPIHSGGGK